jgi:hypothetical protein
MVKVLAEVRNGPPTAGRRDEAPAPQRSGRWRPLQRLGLVSLMAVVTTVVWTGSPLFALWVGSRVQGTGPPSMAAVGTVAVTLGAVSLVLVRVLASLERTYNRLVGRRRGVRRHVAWLRSLRGERPHEEGVHGSLSPLEVVLVASVVIAVIAFEIWFFFFAGSPISSTAGTPAS